MFKGLTALAVLISIGAITGPGSAQTSWIGLGVSCEPVDITGGGFFADITWNMKLLSLGEIGTLSIRPMFGLGPLPLQMKWVVLDALFMVELP